MLNRLLNNPRTEHGLQCILFLEKGVEHRSGLHSLSYHDPVRKSKLTLRQTADTTPPDRILNRDLRGVLFFPYPPHSVSQDHEPLQYGFRGKVHFENSTHLLFPKPWVNLKRRDDQDQ